MVWGSSLLAAAALKTHTRKSYDAQGVNLTFLLAADLRRHPTVDVPGHQGLPL